MTISNVPGPSFPLFLAGARLAGMYPLGPIPEGVGLNMTVMSYCGTVYFGLNACRETVPRVAEFPKMLEESLEELVAPVRGVAGKKAGSKQRATRQRRPAPTS